MAETDRRAPAAASPAVRERMQRQRSRDTSPEVELRRRLHARGLRFRVHRRVLTDVRRHHDIVFGPAALAVETVGCWWHGCPEHYRTPKSNAGWWAQKVARNRERDQDTRERLEAIGWHLEVVWEHEDLDEAADRIERLVAARRARPAGGAGEG